MTAAEFRLIVTGSPEYDDATSLRATLDLEFEAHPAYVTLVVVHDDDKANGASMIAGEWARELASQGLPVYEETHSSTEEMMAAGAHKGLAALRVGVQSKEARKCTAWMIMYGIPCQLLIQGEAKGLPKDLIGPSRDAGTFRENLGRRGHGRPL